MGLVQRANVNQLFDPGLTFDKATGDLSLEGDRVVINKFAIRNGGGSLDLGGNFDIASEVIDAELTVTLPLVENIPWVAALVGGLPIGRWRVSRESGVRGSSHAVIKRCLLGHRSSEYTRG